MKTLREYIEIVEELQDRQDGEYTDEVGMTHTDLHTIMRAARDLANLLDKDEDLPEWVQSKITMAKQNMTTVQDYMLSKHEQGEIKKVD